MKAVKKVGVILILCVISTMVFAGKGGKLAIINQSNYPLILEAQPKKDMEAWKFPESIAAQSSSTNYIEFNRHWLTNADYGSGTVVYKVACPNGQTDKITVRTDIKTELFICSNGWCSESDALNLLVSQEGVNCVITNPQNGAIGWNWNGVVQLIISNRT